MKFSRLPAAHGIIVLLATLKPATAFVQNAPGFVSRHIGLELLDFEEHGTALKMTPSNGTNPTNSTESLSSDVAVLEKDGDDGITETNKKMKDITHDLSRKKKEPNPQLNEDSLTEDLETQLDEYAVLQNDETFLDDVHRAHDSFHVPKSDDVHFHDTLKLNIENDREEDQLLEQSFSDLLQVAESYGNDCTDEILDTYTDNVFDNSEYKELTEYDQDENDALSTEAAAKVALSLSSIDYGNVDTEAVDVNGKYLSLDESFAPAEDNAFNEFKHVQHSNDVGARAEVVYDEDLSVEDAAARAVEAALAAARESMTVIKDGNRAIASPQQISAHSGKLKHEDKVGHDDADEITEFELEAPSLEKDIRTVDQGEKEKIKTSNVESVNKNKNAANKWRARELEREQTIASFHSVFQDFAEESSSVMESKGDVSGVSTVATSAELVSVKMPKKKSKKTKTTRATKVKKKSSLIQQEELVDSAVSAEKQFGTSLAKASPDSLAATARAHATKKRNFTMERPNVHGMKMPQFDVPRLELHNVQQFDVPKIDFPRIDMPVLPEFKMPKIKVDDYQVKKAAFVAKEGVVALAEGLSSVAKESVEVAIGAVSEARRQTSTTKVGKDDELTYDMAFAKVERAGKGFFKLCGIFGAIAKDAAVLVANEVNNRNEQRQALEKAKKAVIMHPQHSAEIQPPKASTERQPSKINEASTRLERNVAPKQIEDHSFAIKEIDSNRQPVHEGPAKAKKTTRSHNTSNTRIRPQMQERNPNLSSLMNNGVIFAHRQAKTHEKQIEEIKARSQEMFGGFFEEVNSMPLNPLKSPRSISDSKTVTARVSPQPKAVTKTVPAVSFSEPTVPFYATRKTTQESKP